MGFSSTLNKIPQYIGIEKASQVIGSWLDKHPAVNKVVMIANHIFRTAAMVGLMYLLPFHPIANFAIGVGASLFYRLTVERFCPFRFALTSCLAAGAFEFSKPYLLSIITGIAFQSLATFGIALAGILPILACTAIIIIVSNYQVDQKYNQQKSSGSCCSRP